MIAARLVDANTLQLLVRVTPNTSANGLGGLWRGPDGETRLKVRVTAPPDRGRANAAVVKVLANSLGIAKSSLRVVAGEKDRLKTVEATGDSEAIRGALKAAEKIIGEGEPT